MSLRVAEHSLDCSALHPFRCITYVRLFLLEAK